MTDEVASDEVEIPRARIVYTIDPENDPRKRADYSLPEVEEVEPWPPPLVTTLDPVPDGITFPSGVGALEKRAKLAGWEHRTGYAYGFKPGRTKGTWAPIETVGVWLQQTDRPSVVFTWERSPESKAAAGPAWKATSAVFHDRHGMARLYSHTAAKAML